MTKLSIIITHHNEPMDIILPLFESINSQLNIDFNDIEIILCDDTNKFFNYSILEQFTHLKNKIIFVNNRCESSNMNRQQGINHCMSDYFMICDCDDKLYDLFTIKTILNNIEIYKDVDIFSYESFNDWTKRNLGCLWMSLWGKVYKKSFFIKNKINLLNLTIFDDFSTAELIKCIKEKNIMEIHRLIYLYIPRDNSTSRSITKSWDDNIHDYICGGIKSIKLIHNICEKDTDIYYLDLKSRLTTLLTWFYWELQKYENFKGSIEAGSSLKKELEVYIVNELINEFGNDCINVVNTFKDVKRWANISDVGNTEAFNEWIIRIFKLEN